MTRRERDVIISFVGNFYSLVASVLPKGPSANQRLIHSPIEACTHRGGGLMGDITPKDVFFTSFLMNITSRMQTFFNRSTREYIFCFSAV